MMFEEKLKDLIDVINSNDSIKNAHLSMIMERFRLPLYKIVFVELFDEDGYKLSDRLIEWKYTNHNGRMLLKEIEMENCAVEMELSFYENEYNEDQLDDLIYQVKSAYERP